MVDFIPELEFAAHVLRAIEAARREHVKASARWKRRGPSASAGDPDEVEAHDDALASARAALDRLNAGAWDEAEALALSCVEVDESWGDGESWREFSILVEEAAALGRQG